MRGSLALDEGELFVGQRVQIRDLSNYDVADVMLDRISTVANRPLVVPTEDEALKGSLGLSFPMTVARDERCHQRAWGDSQAVCRKEGVVEGGRHSPSGGMVGLDFRVIACLGSASGE